MIKLSADELCYVAPVSLFGTKTKKLSEDSTDWSIHWQSLDKYLAQESEQIRLKCHFTEELRTHGKTDLPRYESIKKAKKLHSDNCSKQSKIRQIFGADSPYHPNQLVARRHLPAAGLCEQEIMYKLACKISDLQTLQRRKKLAMDPFDFLRWRIHLKLAKHHFLEPARNGRMAIRAIIRQLCEKEHDRNKYHDPTMRKAARAAAWYEGRLGSYKDGKETKPSSKPRVPYRPNHGRPIPIQSLKVEQNSVRRKEEVLAKRRARLKEFADRPSAYCGVNKFRQSKKK